MDSIAWTLGGNKFKPSNAERDGSTIPPNLNIKLSNGLIVERKGKNSTLKVTDPNGNKAGQQFLDTFIEDLVLNLLKFMDESNKEKTDTLLKIIDVGDQLAILNHKENELYNNRLAIGRIADQREYRKRVDYLYNICKKNGFEVDTQNRNPSRLSRMPGVTRNGKKQFLVATNIGK